MVKEINGEEEFNREIRGPGLVVVDFFATWCGPCRQIAPFIDTLALAHPEVKFIKVDVDRNQDVAGPRGISSIPTFHFYVNGALKDEMKGANPSALEEKVKLYKVGTNPFGGTGFKLSSDSGSAPGNARDARLRQFGAMETARAAPTPAPAPAPAPDASASSGKPPKAAAETEEEEALAQAMAMSLASAIAHSALQSQEAADHADAELELAQLEAAAQPEIHTATEGQEWEEEMVPVPVNEDLLKELLDMGFSDTRARKGLVHGQTLDGALAWIDEHQDDADIDQPYMVRKADTVPKPPLTAEERAQKLEEMKQKIKKRREDRERTEKAEAIRREKERRERGQKMDETMEERQRLARKREAERIKKEKEDAAKERARLKAEIARDKEIRKAHGGVIPSVLGVDGYNPSAVQYDQNSPTVPVATGTSMSANSPATPTVVPAAGLGSGGGASSSSSGGAKPQPRAASAQAKPAQSEASAEERVDQAIATIARYRTGGDGGQALKLLVTFIKNIVEQPQEPKFRSINCESGAFKTKLSGLVGPLALLKAVGFEKDDVENKLKFDGDSTSPLLRSTLAKLVQAEALYRQMNP